MIELLLKCSMINCKKIAVQIVNIQSILDPEKIIIGGGIIQKMLVQKIQEIATEINKIEGLYTPKIIVEQSNLGNDANIYGAYYNYLQDTK